MKKKIIGTIKRLALSTILLSNKHIRHGSNK